MSALAAGWARFRDVLRAVLGDDAYDRYLRHCRARHPEATPLDRREFYAAELDRRWKQVNRCC